MWWKHHLADFDCTISVSLEFDYFSKFCKFLKYSWCRILQMIPSTVHAYDISIYDNNTVTADMSFETFTMKQMRYATWIYMLFGWRNNRYFAHFTLAYFSTINHTCTFSAHLTSIIVTVFLFYTLQHFDEKTAQWTYKTHLTRSKKRNRRAKEYEVWKSK